MAQEKVYLPSTFGSVRTFEDGNSVFNIDFIDVKVLKEFIDKHSKDNKFRISIQKQKNDPAKASVTLNTYEAKQKVETDEDSGDSLPF